MTQHAVLYYDLTQSAILHSSHPPGMIETFSFLRMKVGLTLILTRPGQCIRIASSLWAVSNSNYSTVPSRSTVVTSLSPAPKRAGQSSHRSNLPTPRRAEGRSPDTHHILTMLSSCNGLSY